MSGWAQRAAEESDDDWQELRQGAAEAARVAMLQMREIETLRKDAEMWRWIEAHCKEFRVALERDGETLRMLTLRAGPGVTTGVSLRQELASIVSAALHNA